MIDEWYAEDGSVLVITLTFFATFVVPESQGANGKGGKGGRGGKLPTQAAAGASTGSGMPGQTQGAAGQTDGDAVSMDMTEEAETDGDAAEEVAAPVGKKGGKKGRQGPGSLALKLLQENPARYQDVGALKLDDCSCIPSSCTCYTLCWL